MHTRTLRAALVAVAATCATALAGPLTPPVGAPAPTGKTLTHVEPRIALTADKTPGDADAVFKITELGSYYLTDNLRVPEGFAGIEIEQGCTVDLNGFNIQRDANITAGPAIRIDTNANATVRIFNGSIRLIPSGIVADGIADRVTIEHVAFTNIFGNAIKLTTGTTTGGTGIAAVVRNCQFDEIDGSAIVAGNRATVEGVLANSCGLVSGSAIEIGTTSRVTDTIIWRCGNDALTVGNQVTISRVQIEGPGGAGIIAENRARISDAVVIVAGSDGLRLKQSAVVSDSILVLNGGFGADLSVGTNSPSLASFTNCQFVANAAGEVTASFGTQVGVRRSTFRDCYFFQDSGGAIGVHVLDGSRIERCHFINSIAVQTESSQNTIIDSSFSNANVVLNGSGNFFTKNTLGGTATLIDNAGSNFAPTPTSTPTNAWDNIDQ